MSDNILFMLLNQVGLPAFIAKNGEVLCANDALNALTATPLAGNTAEAFLGTAYHALQMANAATVSGLSGVDGAFTAVRRQTDGYELITLTAKEDSPVLSDFRSAAFISNLSNRLREPSAKAYTLFQNLCSKIPVKYYTADRPYFDELNKSLHLNLKITNQLRLLAMCSQAGDFMDMLFGNLSQAFRRMAESAVFYAGLCGTELTFSLCDEDVFMDFSEQHFTYMMFSLVSNALKYNRDNRPVALALERSGEAVCITVADNGIGISEDLLQTIFEHMSYAALAKKLDSGIGAGLHIVRTVVDMMKGQIAIASKEGEGTTVRITLPVLEKAIQGDRRLGQPSPPPIGTDDYLSFFADCLPAEEFGLET